MLIFQWARTENTIFQILINIWGRCAAGNYLELIGGVRATSSLTRQVKFLLPALLRQMQMDLYEFKADLVYIVLGQPKL